MGTLSNPNATKKADKATEASGHKNQANTNSSTNNPGFSGISLQCLTTKEKVFPWIYHKNCEDFSYHNCIFGVHKSKESTGRAVVFREFGITNSYTLECSFCGPTQGKLRDCHFTIKSLINMGELFAKTILEFNNFKMHKIVQTQIE